MPKTFSFDANYIVSANPLEVGDFTTGYSSILRTPSGWASAIAPSQSIATSTGVDVFTISLVAGQRYDFNLADAGLQLEFEIIDQNGNVARDTSGREGRGQDYNDGYSDLSFTAGKTGVYFVAVHYVNNDYVNGSFGFDRTTGPTGSYQFGVSTAAIPSVVRLSDSSNSYYDTAGAHTVRANGGDDIVRLYEGNDIALGGSGNDQLYGGSGDDDLSGQGGRDTIEAGTGNDAVRGGDDADLLSGNAGNDGIMGGSGNDVLYGDTSNDALATGNDSLWGESGNDVIYGGAGSDMIRGGAGVDQMVGGSGADTFHFLPTEANFSSSGNEDRIYDFARGSDRIDLSDVVWGDLGFIGSTRFQDHAGTNEVRVDAGRVAGWQEVQVDFTGDSVADLAILVRVTSGSALSSSDFLL